MERGVNISFDLEKKPLEIKTNSALGSEDEIRLYFLSADGNRSGAIVIRFSQKIEYTIARCLKSFHGIQEVSPNVTDNIWKVTLNKTTDIQLQIHCNNVKTIDMVISDETCGRSEWRTFWSMVTEKIRFQANDTASVFYRYGSGK